MVDYKEKERKIEVPKGTGIDGFLKTIELILRQPRVQNIHINARGEVIYRRFVREDEPNDELRIDFETLMPWAVIRNTELQETVLGDNEARNASIAIGKMFQYVSRDHLHPVAFVIHPNSPLWEWHAKTTGIILNRDQIYGLPVLTDEQIPEESMILCAGYGRDARLIDTVKSYRIVIYRGEK